MKLTRIRPVGRYINPITGVSVNVKKGTRRERSTDHYFFLRRGHRVFIDHAEFSTWKRLPDHPVP